MSRNLSDLKAECVELGLAVNRSGKREAKSDYETVLRQYYWRQEYGDKPLPAQYEPMLARNEKDLSATEAGPLWADNSRYVAQRKINGCRGILQVNPTQNPYRKNGELRNEATSRRMSDATYRLAELTDNLPFYRDFPFLAKWQGAVVDGEFQMPVAEVNTGDTITKGILQATVATLNCSPEKSADIQKRHGTMRFYVFDMLKGEDGEDLRGLSYAERYQVLERFVADFEAVCQANGWPIP
jgi:hypothetical protein